MQVSSVVNRRAPRLLFTLTVFIALSLSMFAPLVSAAPGKYSAADIETWLEDAISGTVVTVENPPVVELTPSSQLLKVTNLSFELRGITVGLNDLRVTTYGSTTVHVVGELDVLNKLPRFSCDLEMEYVDGVNQLHVSDISNIVIADTFTPSLSPGDIATIVDVLNKILDASELSVTSPGGDLTGIDVVDEGIGARLKTTWSDGDPVYLEATEIADKVDGMADKLAAKATTCLGTVDGEWSVVVEIPADPPGDELQIHAEVHPFDIIATFDAAVTFEGLTASVDGTLGIGSGGEAPSKTVTFSAEAEIGCSGGDPSVAMASLTLGNEYPGLQSFIADVEPALLNAIDQAVNGYDAVGVGHMAGLVEATGLMFPFCPSSITIDIEGEVGDEVGYVVLHESAEPYLIVGDTNLDGRVTMADVLTILQYRAGTITLSNDQLRCADTNADERVTMADGLHIMQFRADPYSTLGILSKPLYDPEFHEGMIDPLTLL